MTDEAPEEILVRGPVASGSYQSACEAGALSVYRTRLVLSGQDAIGKEALKKNLMGVRYDNRPNNNIHSLIYKIYIIYTKIKHEEGKGKPPHK